MGYPLSVLKRVMTWAEFIGWMQFYAQEPFDDRRGDRASAEIATVFANAHRDRSARPQPFHPRDFMPFERPMPLSDDELEQRILKDL